MDGRVVVNQVEEMAIECWLTRSSWTSDLDFVSKGLDALLLPCSDSMRLCGHQGTKRGHSPKEGDATPNLHVTECEIIHTKDEFGLKVVGQSSKHLAPIEDLEWLTSTKLETLPSSSTPLLLKRVPARFQLSLDTRDRDAFPPALTLGSGTS